MLDVKAWEGLVKQKNCSKLHQPGPPKGCFLEVFGYIKATKKQPFGGAGTLFFLEACLASLGLDLGCVSNVLVWYAWWFCRCFEPVYHVSAKGNCLLLRDSHGFSAKKTKSGLRICPSCT